ncbi:MAG: hypothetical protein ACMXYM_01930 [Candidatus Woesearchaeota archaeon]
MLDRIQRAGLGAQFKDTLGLVKTTLTVFGADADVKKPIIGMIVLDVILVWLVLGGFTLALFAGIGGVGSIGIPILLIFLGIMIYPFRVFYDAFQRAKVSALGYDVARGEDATIPKAKERIRPIRGTLFMLGLIDMIVNMMKSRSRGGGGIVGIIVTILVAVLAEVWDLISNFLLPAVVIEQKGPKHVVSELKELKRNIPAALVGVLGFDAFGMIAKRLVFGVYLVLGGIGIVLPLFLFGANPITLTTTLVTLTLIILATAIISKTVLGAKTIYFTLFYMALLRPHEINASMSDACTNLLPTEVARAAQAQSQPADQPTPGQAPASESESAEPSTRSAGGPTAAPEALVTAVRAMRGKGGTDDQISAFLTRKGYSEDMIRDALTRA